MVSRLQIYKRCRRTAKQRGIPFLLTFEQWCQIWDESGLFDKRGPLKNQYVMARFGDRGSYEEGNVKIILSGENVREARIGKKMSKEQKFKLSLALRGNQNRTGRRHSEESRRKMSITRKGMRPSEETRRKMSIASKGNQRRKGKRHTMVTRHKISESIKKHWAENRRVGV